MLLLLLRQRDRARDGEDVHPQGWDRVPLLLAQMPIEHAEARPGAALDAVDASLPARRGTHRRRGSGRRGGARTDRGDRRGDHNRGAKGEGHPRGPLGPHRKGRVPRVEGFPRRPEGVQGVARRAVGEGKGPQARGSRGGGARSLGQEGEEGGLTAADRTFVLLKPDAVHRGLVGEIVGRFERRGLKLVALKMVRVTRSLAETYYAEHKGKAFFEPLMSYIAAGPVVAMVLEGDGAVAAVRRMMGKTNSAEAEPGTIRGDLALTIGRNVIHGSWLRE